MFQTGTVAQSTLELLKRLQEESALAATRLVGGTALSLHIGHCVSEDLDLFSSELKMTDNPDKVYVTSPLKKIKQS